MTIKEFSEMFGPAGQNSMRLRSQSALTPNAVNNIDMNNNNSFISCVYGNQPYPIIMTRVGRGSDVYTER